ncbi:hypothetical protein [Nodosilinea sp. P-1105]|uniref:hypothetical protein n=1 Tax=Nodosilinea sp. P-1105 TaxID=2546229 RepID=UPI00146D5AE1|nr:hypothetical protein [Nodosilinea sp. P-1105]
MFLLLNGALVACLMDLEAQEAMPTMEKAFSARRVDEEIPGSWKIVKSEMGLMAGSGLGSLQASVEVEPHFAQPKSTRQSAKSSQGFGAATKPGKKKKRKKQK